MTLQISQGDLSDRRLAFVEAYISGTPVNEAALRAGFSHGQYGYVLLKQPEVQAALHDYRERLIKTDGATLAYRTLIDLMKPGNAGGVRFQAAKYMLDAAGHGVKDESGHTKDLHEMTAEELEEAIAKLDGALDAKAEAAKPVNGRISDGSAG